MEIQWNANVDLSAMHAAWCLNRLPDACRNCSDELRQSATLLFAAAEKFNVPLNRFLELIIPLSVDTPGNRDLAERVLVRLVPASARTESRISELASGVATFKSRYLRDFPNFANDMRLRAEPLRQQWEAYGPGLLVLIGNRTDANFLAERAEVMLVEPFAGGAGFAHLSTNRCHIEAVLTNSHSQLTETLRLAWLLSQLDFERPAISDLINAQRLRQVAGLAMLPPTLLAGEELGMCDYSAGNVESAIERWHIAGPTENPAALSQVVMTWWETVEATSPQWRIALTGLDRMLA